MSGWMRNACARLVPTSIVSFTNPLAACFSSEVRNMAGAHTAHISLQLLYRRMFLILQVGESGHAVVKILMI